MDNQFSVFMNNAYKDNTLSHLQYSLKKDSKKNILHVAKEVEGLFINIMLQSMRHSIPKNGLLENNAESMYTDIYDQQISKKMSEKGFGLSDMIIEQILHNKNIKKN
ncbi:MAG TPA: rod-binding protein [Buchnera sp. (in: enterobacteria)]|nr:rod-binding protein [Buchnera sp. (in: enterobacteria)]